MPLPVFAPSCTSPAYFCTRIVLYHRRKMLLPILSHPTKRASTAKSCCLEHMQLGKIFRSASHDFRMCMAEAKAPASSAKCSMLWRRTPPYRSTVMALRNATTSSLMISLSHLRTFSDKADNMRKKSSIFAQGTAVHSTKSRLQSKKSPAESSCAHMKDQHKTSAASSVTT